MNLSPQTLWLLFHLREKHDAGIADKQIRKPLGIAAIAPLPVPDTLPGGKVSMNQMRGLLRRGWADERYNGIYYITQEGLSAASRLSTTARTEP